MDNRNICCFDFETGSKDKTTCEILQIGSAIIDRNNLTIIDKFQSLMKPENFDALEDEALKINGLTKEQLQDAPDITIVFPMWAEWIQRHNIYKNKSSFGAPIPCGWGIDGFDIPILNRYCHKFKYWDNKWNNNTLMNPVFSFDVMKHIWFWTRNNPDVKNIKLPTVLEYMGLSATEIEQGAHDASWDVEQTAKIAIKLLKLELYLTEINVNTGRKRLELKDCLKNE